MNVYYQIMNMAWEPEEALPCNFCYNRTTSGIMDQYEQSIFKRSD